MKTDKPIMQDLRAPDSLATQVFAALDPPRQPFDPDGNWSHRYHDLSTFNPKSKMGALTLRHQPGRQLRIVNYRLCPNGYRTYTTADLRCRQDLLSTPENWRMESKVSKHAQDNAYLNSGLVKSARVNEGVLTLQTGASQRNVELPGEYTCKWCLLDAVGRMARQATKAISFTLLDEYDEICPDQHIMARGALEVDTRGGTIQVSCYQHTGIGTMPGVFYVDTEGRVLVYMAGMQLLVLADPNGKDA